MTGKQHIILLQRKTHTGNDSERKQNFLQHKENHSNNTDGSKSTGRKVGFAAVYADIIRREENDTSKVYYIKYALKNVKVNATNVGKTR